jgi:hypothetical protein
LYKDGDKTDLSNYRPISGTSIFARLFERVVHYHLFNHVKDKIHSLQAGFQIGRNTHQLIFFLRKMIKLSLSNIENFLF